MFLFDSLGSGKTFTMKTSLEASRRYPKLIFLWILNMLTLVFVETKRSVDSLESWLCRIGFLATAIHGDKVQAERKQALKLFKNGVAPILVATDVVARRLDISRVVDVINFYLPQDINRIGRMCWAGKSGLATTFFFNSNNAGIAKALSEVMNEAHQEAPNWLSEYAEGYSSSSDRGGGCGSRFGHQDFRSSYGNSYGTNVLVPFSL